MEETKYSQSEEEKSIFNLTAWNTPDLQENLKWKVTHLFEKMNLCGWKTGILRFYSKVQSDEDPSLLTRILSSIVAEPNTFSFRTPQAFTKELLDYFISKSEEHFEKTMNFWKGDPLSNKNYLHFLLFHPFINILQ
jgi:hypothetical protein